jgi:hypothetical protein
LRSFLADPICRRRQEDVRTHGSNAPLNKCRQQSLVRLEALAKLMDGAFVIPVTTIRFGLDGVIGLIPKAGDLIASTVPA